MATPYSELGSVLQEVQECAVALIERAPPYEGVVRSVLAEIRLLESDLKGAPDRPLDPIEERIVRELAERFAEVGARMEHISHIPGFRPDEYALITDEIRSAVRQAQRVLRSGSPPEWEK